MSDGAPHLTTRPFVTPVQTFMFPAVENFQASVSAGIDLRQAVSRGLFLATRTRRRLVAGTAWPVVAAAVAIVFSAKESSVALLLALPTRLGAVPLGLRLATETRPGGSLRTRFAGLVTDRGALVIATGECLLAHLAALPGLSGAPDRL